MFNGNNSPTLKSLTPSLQNYLIELSKFQQISKSDFHQSLIIDQTDFSCFTISQKEILSTNRFTVSLSENSVQSFYLGDKRPQPKPKKEPPLIQDNCLEDAQNCQYFQFFDSKEKKLLTNCKDGIETNFWGLNQTNLFLTGTYNTSQENHYAWTRNWNPQDPCWDAYEKPWLKEWTQSQDPHAEPMKVHLPPVKEDPTQFSTITKCKIIFHFFIIKKGKILIKLIFSDNLAFKNRHLFCTQ